MKKKMILVIAVALGSTTSLAHAEEGGCLKYGAAGAAAGHFVGSGHAVMGGAAGCITGMWRRHEARKAEREEQRETEQLNSTSHDGGMGGLKEYSRQNGYATDGYDQPR